MDPRRLNIRVIKERGLGSGLGVPCGFSCASGATMVFALAILMLVSGVVLSLILMAQTQNRVSFVGNAYRVALSAAESGVNEGMEAIASAGGDFEVLSKDVASIPTDSMFVGIIGPAANKRWVKNDGRYADWGIGTNIADIVLTTPELLSEDTFYVTGLRQTGSDGASREYCVTAVGGVYSLFSTNPVVRALQTSVIERKMAETNALDGELIAYRGLFLDGDVKMAGIQGEEVANLANAETALSVATNEMSVVIPFFSGNPEVPGGSRFRGENQLCGYLLMNRPDLPPTILPQPFSTNDENGVPITVVPSTADVQNKEDLPGLVVGSSDFLTNENREGGYETNHIVTRILARKYPSLAALEEANCKDAPLVNIGSEKEPQMVYKFDASGDYKITAAELYPMMLSTGAVVRLMLPENYVLTDPAVTMEGGAQLLLYPKGNVTVGAQSFAAVERGFRRLSIVGGTNTEQKIQLNGAENMLLCAQVYAPASELILTNGLVFSGAMVGGKVQMTPGTRFLGCKAARSIANLPGVEADTNSSFLVKDVQELQLSNVVKNVPDAGNSRRLFF